MFKKLRVIFRSFRRDKNYVLLNSLGLTSGIIVFLLVALYVSHEFNYDEYHEKKDRIFRIYKTDIYGDYQGSHKYATTPGPLAPALEREFPEVEHAARMVRYANTLMTAGNETFLEPTIYIADPQTFKIFSIEPLHGSISGFLGERNSVAISESVAKKYFGKTSVLNETIQFRDQLPLKVSGVFKDMPKNSHFTMDIVVHLESIMTFQNESLNRWNNNGYYTFLTTQSGVKRESLQEKLPLIRAKYANDPIDADGQEASFFLQSLKEAHFAQDVNFDIAPNVDRQRLYIYLAIASLVLLIAGINYINLSTARSMSKIKEIGVRKIIGAQNHNLIIHSLLESGVIVSLALTLSLVCTTLLLPTFSQFVGRELTLDFEQPKLWFALIGASFGLSLLTGIYPALLLTSFKPIASLKGIDQRNGSQRGSILRSILVIFQFTVSSGLIIIALVMSKQMNFVENIDTGYVRDQVVVLGLRDAGITKQLPAFKQELKSLPGVLAVSSSSSLPNNVISSSNAYWPGKSEDTKIPIYIATVDYDFFDLYELAFAEGRPFKRDIASDKKGVILNEAAVKAIGWKDPIGQAMITQSGDTGRVVGVIKDFHQHSLRQKIEPLQIFLSERHRTISVKISGGQLEETVAAIEATYDKFSPKYPFDYSYFDDIFDRAYLDEIKTAQLARGFTFLVIIVACLGLYGLSAHKVRLKIKEVGVRKILGAPLAKILILLSKDFLLLSSLAFFIAAPVAYYLMSDWLNGYAYHTSIDHFTFLTTFVIMIAITGLAVGGHTYRVAIRNPIESLKAD